MRLESKVAIVTGASGGLGRAISIGLANEGAAVVVNDINLEGATAVANEIKAAGHKAIVIKADVTKSAEVNRMVKTTLDQLGGVDILVNCAGGSGAYGAAVLFQEMSEETWDFVINLNLKSQRNCCRAVLDHMVQKRSGKIINIASDAGILGDSMQTAYSAAKAGVIVFTKSLSKELGQYGIRVNAISPGSIRHPGRPKVGAKYEEKLKRIPLGRFGVPEEIASVVVFLASDESSYMTGNNIQVGGGRD